MTRVVLLEDYLDYARQLACMQRLVQRVDLQVYTTKAASEADIVERTRQADIVITIRDRVVYTPGLLAQLRHLHLLSVCGARLTHIDLDAAIHYGSSSVLLPYKCKAPSRKLPLQNRPGI